MNKRIKELRKALGLTQQEFADRIGIKRNTVAQYEIGRNEPIETVISLICREFDVNKTWLRTGEGEMFIKLSRDEEILASLQLSLKNGHSNFRRRFIHTLTRLSDAQWDALEKIIGEIEMG